MTVTPLPMASPAIETRDVYRVYTLSGQHVTALRGVTLTIPARRFVVLQGRSGSGKTTLLNCLSGLDRPTTGTVRVAGCALHELNGDALTHWRWRHIGLVFQSFALLPNLSAYENVELVLRMGGLNLREGRARALECLEAVGLSRWSHHRPYEMSGGQQQRVAIARALAARPPLLLADEPTGELDSATAREVFALFRHLVNEQGVTVLLTSHDPLAAEYADEVIRLQDGQVS